MTSATRSTLRAPTLSVQAPATRVATMPSSPANAYAPMRSDEYEYGGCDSATPRPAHTAQNAKNQRVPRPAASRSGANRTYSPGSPRTVTRYPEVVLAVAPGSTNRAEPAMIAHAAANTRNIPRQPISSLSQPPTIRPARIPAEMPAVT